MKDIFCEESPSMARCKEGERSDGRKVEVLKKPRSRRQSPIWILARR